jgi:ketosteroid isomerase-like protein
MNDLLAINTAKSEYRDAFNFGDVERLRAITDPDIVVFRDGDPSAFGADGLEEVITRLRSLFDCYTAKMVITGMEIQVDGNSANAYGWQDLKLTHKNGTGTIHRRSRYVDVWRKNKEGSWKLLLHIDNQDVADPFQNDDTLPGRNETTVAPQSY